MIWIVVVVVAVAVVVGIVAGRAAQRRQREELERNDCPLCGSNNTFEAPDGSWRCLACGYESTWENRPDLRPLVHAVQDLARALDCFARARSALSRAGSLGVGLGLTAGLPAQERQECLAEAQSETDTGIRLLGGIAQVHPDLLLAAPDPGASAGRVALADSPIGEVAGHPFAEGTIVGHLIARGETRRVLAELDAFDERIRQARANARLALCRAVSESGGPAPGK